MAGTKVPRDVRRANRWIDRSGGLAYVPPDAFDLLSRRLALRRRVAWQCSPLVLIPLGILVVGWIASGFGTSNSLAGWTVLAFVMIAIEARLMDRILGRAEQRIGLALPHRVSRGTAVSVATMLGRARVVALAATIAIETGLAVTLLSQRGGWITWTYLLGFAGSCCLVAIGVRQAATRATVAADPFSLAIDERLRSEDAFAATLPLTLLLIAFPASAVGGPGHAWIDLLWLVSLVAVGGLIHMGRTHRPWVSVAPRGTWLPRRPVVGEESP
jgi:hypothetical protein